MPNVHATIALAGQPNVGKSTVFNILTGLNQHVGNWPGKTVEQRTGTFVHDEVEIDIVDLPGTYCLTAASPEETVTRDYIIQHRPDVVIAVISAASLERNLYLVAELLALPAPLVIGLNMMDVAHQEGFDVEPNVLAAAMGVPVIAMTAAHGQGVHELIDAAVDVIRHGPAREPSRPMIREDHREVMADLLDRINGHVPAPYPPDWVALKLLEGDAEVTEMMRGQISPADWAPIDAILHRHEDAIIAVAGGRYEWIRRMTRAALKRPRAGRITLTQRMDLVATHPFWGMIMLAAVLALTFGLTYSVGVPLQEWLSEHFVGGLANLAVTYLPAQPAWIQGLVVDGILGGVGTMITFVAHPGHLFRGHGPAGRYRLYGAGRLHDGPLYACHRPTRQELYAPVSGLWLQCARRHGYAHHRVTARAAGHHAPCAPGALPGPPGRTGYPGADLFPASRHAGHLGTHRLAPGGAGTLGHRDQPLFPA